MTERGGPRSRSFTRCLTEGSQSTCDRPVKEHLRQFNSRTLSRHDVLSDKSSWSAMTEEMVGGQHRSDESDTDPSVKGEHANARDRCLRSRRWGVSRGGQHPGKKLLPRPTSLEKADFSGASGYPRRFQFVLR